MRGGSGDHFPGACFRTQPDDRFDRTDTLPAAATNAVDQSLTGINGTQKINGPAVQVNAVDKIRLALGGFTEMFPRRIVRIGNRSFAIAIVDRILAPDVTLAHVNVLFFCKKT